jgi:UDP-glucose 4-epimerase
MVKTFSQVNDVPVPYQICPRRPGDIATCYADPGKSAEILGWKAIYSLDDMCRDSWNWQKNNPMGYES